MIWKWIPFLPDQASSAAGSVDALFIFLVGLSVFFSILIAVLVTVFAVRYRRGSRADRTNPPHDHHRLELFWTGVPLVIALVIFGWGASIFVHLYRIPDDAMPISVVGKRWMWKLQHMTGRREINELHVPLGRAVKLTMTSEDVIHSFYVPAFRVKADVLPGRYTTLWFRPTRPGRYHLFCAEYCGTKHSGMIGSIVVLEPDAFQAWLGGETAGIAPAAAGETLFRNLGCVTCHRADSQGRGPDLDGLFGRKVLLAGGREIVADEEYLRESILDPGAKLVSGYQALMPTFKGLVTEEGVMHIIEYIKSTPGGGEAAPAGAEAPAASARPEAEAPRS